jgi:hypothetical protein
MYSTKTDINIFRTHVQEAQRQVPAVEVIMHIHLTALVRLEFSSSASVEKRLLSGHQDRKDRSVTRFMVVVMGERDATTLPGVTSTVARKSQQGTPLRQSLEHQWRLRRVTLHLHPAKVSHQHATSLPQVP